MISMSNLCWISDESLKNPGIITVRTVFWKSKSGPLVEND
ncbi:hypothetical protein D1AOALGA4SA_12627 [Olavius algarvensis Delta 1 endosymbiont]|nr:hypothetical protein D1AOALGA4SA_12627 [Olavius algarvensis Delta 1 endosymbiont]